MIDKRISKSDKLASLKRDRSRVLYFMIYPHTDVAGRYSADPRDIKEDCCPRLKYSVAQVEESLRDLNEAGLLILYEVEGQRYLEITRFEDFQTGIRADREAESKIPAYSGPTPEHSGSTPSLSLSLSSSLSLKNKGHSPAQIPPQVAEELTEIWKRVKKGESPPARPVEIIAGIWNVFAKGHKLSTIEKIEPGSAREKSLIARLCTPDFDIENVLRAIHEQPFLCGDNDRGWLVTFDWILSPKNLTKIMERAYVKNRIGDAARRAPEDPYVGGRRG
ncbi:MAG: hypothetical protein ABFD52_08960 [Acidobacteriota bacterium]